MTDIHESTQSYAQHLASLPSDEARAQAEQQKRQMVLAQLPDEAVGRPPIRPLGEYLDDEIELPPMLVEPGLVARGAITSMTARGGKGKTAVSLNRLLRYSMGLPMFDALPDVMKPVQPLRVLLIENEGAPGHFQKVLRTILYEQDFTTEQRELARENVIVWGDGGWSGLKLDDDANLDLVDRATGQCEADIVFLEPFRGLWRGNENDSTEMANVLDSLSGLAVRHACGVLITHHERKSGVESSEDAMSAARGSGALEGHAAVMERWVPVKGGKQRELSWIKARFDEAPADVRMEFDRETWGYRYVQEHEVDREIKAFLQQFPDSLFGAKAIADEIGEDYHLVRRRANLLVEDGQVRKKSVKGEGVQYALKRNPDGPESDAVAIT